MTSNNKPLVSIVSPSYNQGAYIEDMIRSVAGQTYDYIEHIVIDGGSQDNTIDILEDYSGYLDYWVSEPDDGPASALNKGFRKATGSVFGILNSDDLLLPHAVETAVRVLSATPEIDVVSGNGYIIDDDNRIQERTYSTSRFVLSLYAYDSFFLVQQSTFWRREAHERTDGFNEDTPVAWDSEFWADLFLEGATYTYIDEFLSGFRCHDQSITVSGRYLEKRAELKRRIFRKVYGREPGVFDCKLVKPLVRCIGKFFPPTKFQRYLPAVGDSQESRVHIPEID